MTNLEWSDNKGIGVVNGVSVNEKPNLSFQYEWIQFNDQAKIFTKKEIDNYPNSSPTEEEFIDSYVNRELSTEQIEEVRAYCQAWEKVPKSVTELYIEKKLEIESQAQSLFAQPVEVDGIIWRGGQNSASSILGDITLASELGETTVNLRDAERKPRAYSLENARVVAATIGLTYRKHWNAEEDALEQLETINLDDPDAIQKINAITIQLGG